MKLTFYCAMCGKEKELAISQDDLDPGMTVRRLIEGGGWIVQFNDPHFDVYCSKAHISATAMRIGVEEMRLDSMRFAPKPIEGEKGDE